MRKGFSGFSEGVKNPTPLPNEFFTELLPIIDHLGELRVTLYALWSLSRKEGNCRYVRREEFAADRLFMEAMGSPGMTAEEALTESLERAVTRGTMLRAEIQDETGPMSFYFLNDPQGRAAVESIASGRWHPSGEADSPIEIATERPNIFNLYEQNIGPLTPMIAESLREAETEYPPEWIEEAMQIAVENNVRKWRYIEAILEDWKVKGKDTPSDRGDTEKARRRYIQGEFSDHLDT